MESATADLRPRRVWCWKSIARVAGDVKYGGCSSVVGAEVSAGDGGVGFCGVDGGVDVW